MPRKTVTASNIKFETILNFFRTSSLEIADFAVELVNSAVKERHAKGKAVLAGRSKGGATEAVNAATQSAIGDGVAAPVKEKKKPGPPKGTGKGKRKGGAAPAAVPAADGAAPVEVTDAAALLPQDGALDLDAQ